MKKIFILLFGLLVVPLFFIRNLFASEIVSIEATNVASDLRILYGGNNPNSFDIYSLVPPSDQNLNFKILAIKPLDGNLYIYGYTKILYDFFISGLDITYSNSTTQGENGGFIENFFTTSSRLINTYGYGDVFFKVSIDNFVSLNTSGRFFIDSATLFAGYYNIVNQLQQWPIYYNNINDELFYNIGSTYDNFIYEYFKDDYIVITDKQVNLFLTGKDIDNNILGHENYRSYYEDFYVFFNTDLSIDELIEAQYSYLYYSYSVNYHYSANSGAPLLAYPGLMDDSNAFNISSVYINSTITSGVTTKSVNVPYFSWWTQSKVYSLENIQDCNDLSNLESEEYSGFKDLINDINSNRVASNKDPFSWTFKAASDVRVATRTINEYTGNSWYFNGYSVNNAHEIKQLQILRLKFRTNNQTFDLNALDWPSDTEEVYILNVPYVLLLDQIFNYISHFFSNISHFFSSLFTNPFSFFSNIFSSIVPILLIIVAIILAVFLIRIIIKARDRRNMSKLNNELKKSKLKTQPKTRTKKKGVKK